MAAYQDIPPHSSDPAELWTQLTTLLVGAHSIEVIPTAPVEKERDSVTGVVLRVWFSPAYDESTHAQV
jgi:hypothetical protein